MANSDSTAGNPSSQPAAAGAGAASAAPSAPASAASAASSTTAPAASAAPATAVADTGKPASPDAGKAAEAAPAAGAKPTEAAKPAEGEKPAAPAQPQVGAVPEQYELKAPEGLKLDEPFIQAMTPAFKAAKLDNAQVQGLVDAYVQHQRAIVPGLLARDLEATKKDPAIGGLNYGRTIGRVNNALSVFTSPEFRSKLERWGIANDLDFVRCFEQIGAQMEQDEPVSGGNPRVNREDVPMADRIYGRAQKGSQT